MNEHLGLTLTSVDPTALPGGTAAAGDAAPGTNEQERDAARVRGFGEAVSRAFLQGRGDEAWHERWLTHLRADAVTLRGAWVDEPALGGSTIPVATFSSFDKTLNVGAGRKVALRMITDVTVSPAYRRRGLTRHLMGLDLDDAVARGVPVAALTASEGAIYGRFGFGPATWQRRITVDTARFALRPDVAGALGSDPGQMVVVEPDEAWPAVAEVFGRWHGETRGSVDRPQFYEPFLSGSFDFDHGGPDKKLRAVVHLDADGRPDGHVLYKPAGEVDGVEALDVVDLLALSPATYLRLWRFVAEMDLIRTVRWNRAQLVDPLDHALLDARAVRTLGTVDMIWLRVLDMATALEARPWYGDGEVVLDVDDALGHAAGRWRVTVRDGAAEVRAESAAVDAATEVRLSADTLGSLYLGGVPVPVLHQAARLGGSAEAVAALAAIADGGPPPYAMTGF